MTKKEREQCERDLAAVQQEALALRYVKDQTPEICLAAVKQNGYSLRFVKEQTLEICMAAIKECGDALRYVENQTPEIYMAAVKRNCYALEHVKDVPMLKRHILEQMNLTDKKRFSLFGNPINSKEYKKLKKVLDEIEERG